ncbi:hypothetical protein [Jeongeupia naejangsanensis]|uniref:Uncharacterized protein n=1 Tax=Jeongeupia naejangsanensis TaxID=613195 RepID=A0ABS2BHJ9_9NEIS|nr:hypothetical protein [Jeongeupia naejangsanensis]MBM3114563.1 hypothetical protein [Jeongeupia naejangsanensis]
MQTYYLLFLADGRTVIDNVVPAGAEVFAECDAESRLAALDLLAGFD